MEISRRRFEELVADALDAIPPDLAAEIDNVAIVVEDWPDEAQRAEHGDVLGLYEGVSLTDRGFFDGPTLPDRVTVFRGPLCAASDSEEELVEQVLVTVVHEIAHHFGIDDDRLEELGWG